MRVLAVMGSPRKGESYKLAKTLEENLRSFGELEFEYLFLKDHEIKTCKGCETCFTKGEENCPLKDDRDLVIEKMIAADGVVFVSPVYSQQVTSLMKIFIDRLSYLWHRPFFFRKKAMALSTGGGMFKETLGYMKTNLKNWGFDFVEEIGVPHPDSLTPKFRKKSLDELKRKSETFYEALKKNETRVPGLGDLIWFRIWKINTAVLPYDRGAWEKRGWLGADYYYEVKINPFKKAVADLVAKLAKWYIKRVYTGY